ncbi:acyl carrier protein [Hoeflea prorocentri]|uniref:Acyl carrier protein n=1 Tax=Hoeflea prorocentri TaxID=1922333 RepID=A0A9X3ZIE3_9HYPH|nr:acyl carrier protein [Hoeflea prorocentri]MCY6381751.1 acyl carrier protein [Hoeflea prorocentri]MDA5399551.1 acyl carrier protein [Hoeflea prorocentri]
MQSDVTSAIREFVVDNFLFREDMDSVSDTDSLLENGLMDSTGVLELVAFLETDIGIDIQDDEIVPDNFDSISKISRYANAKLAKNGG